MCGVVSVNFLPRESLMAFDCGVFELNEYLKIYAAQNDKKNVGKTFVLVDDNGAVKGFYTLANAQISFSELPKDVGKKLPRYPIPAIRIARLAVDSRYKGVGVGATLLRDALQKILRLAKETGICFVVVDAKETSKTFYEHFGFLKLPERELTYILSVGTLQKAKEI